ncbi:MAG: hypothetical protein A4E57_00040 [Syntrophorhabdaceae bacterium PtaU1.Bin034]|jgi:hypothetical protein|nr:MAG: hypothetical protein A4E57_00040 [Syntrophorhabdaceae bacterium PtaU1.Bin034]
MVAPYYFKRSRIHEGKKQETAQERSSGTLLKICGCVKLFFERVGKTFL